MAFTLTSLSSLSFLSAKPTFSNRIDLENSFLGFRSRYIMSRVVLCQALSSGPGPPEPDEEPPIKNAEKVTDLEASLSRAVDGVQIFLAVLFWMSLFFWASVWDGRNNRPNMKSWFRR